MLAFILVAVVARFASVSRRAGDPNIGATRVEMEQHLLRRRADVDGGEVTNLIVGDLLLECAWHAARRQPRRRRMGITALVVLQRVSPDVEEDGPSGIVIVGNRPNFIWLLQIRLPLRLPVFLLLGL